MSITNLERTEKYIVKWIKDYAKNAGIKTLIVGLSGGIDSALVALLCKKTRIPTLCVNMPCHSSSFSYDRARSFAEEFKLDLIKIDLTQAHESITNQVDVFDVHADTTDLPRCWGSILTKEGVGNPIAVGGLRSCLRAPTLNYLSNATKGIIVGTGNRSEDGLIRYFNKFGDGCVDISPIADLFKGEVYELFAYMAGITTNLHFPGSEVATNVGPDAAVAIYEATPTADLWGPDGGHQDEDELGLSYDEIEWADRQNMHNGIVESNEDPVKNTAWQAYSARQRQVIAKMHGLEKTSRHKYNPNLPVCQVRGVPGLVR